MSQHQIHLSSPAHGQVLVTAGFDPILRDGFVSIVGHTIEFMSPDGTQISDIPRLVREKLGVELPAQVVEAVQGDLADFRLGAQDLGRRISRYESNGQLAHCDRW